MKNYYEILSVPKNASKQKTYQAFRKRYLEEKNIEVKIDLLAGLLLIVNEHQKFLDILLNQKAEGIKLNQKYERAISLVHKQAEQLIKNTSTETQIKKVLKNYPFEEAALGVLEAFLGGTRYYFNLSYLLIIIGCFFLIHIDANIYFALIGIPLFALGIYTHIRIVRFVKITKIQNFTAYNTAYTK